MTRGWAKGDEDEMRRQALELWGHMEDFDITQTELYKELEEFSNKWFKNDDGTRS